MDEIREDRLIHNKRIEKLIRDFEENEAKTNEAIRRKAESYRPTRIGPAYELLQYLYILEKQNQNDSEEIRKEAEEDVLEYLDQFRTTIDEVGEEDNDDQTSDESPQPTSTLSLNSQTFTITNPPPATVSSPSVVGPPSPQQPTIIPSSQQSAVIPFSQQSTVILSLQQPPIGTASAAQASSSVQSQLLCLPATADSNYIRPDTLVRFQKFLSDAEQYERRYKTIDSKREIQLRSRIRETMNKLGEDTVKPLANEILAFINGREQKVNSEYPPVSNEEERLLCLSIVANLIFDQLLGSDLDEKKTKIFLPLIGIFSEDKIQKEFSTIFLDRLHKKCPYTVPYYPQRPPTMTDKEYLKAMGYIELKEGGQLRLQTDSEFLARMSGLIRLFCKLLVRRGPPFDNQLFYAWKWFADVLNIPPRPNLTAIIIRIFLDEAGESMVAEYSKQFMKLLDTIGSNMLKLAKETDNGQIVRLKHTLDTLIQKK